MDHLRSRRDRDREPNRAAEPERVPGRSTLTQRLPPSPGSRVSAPAALPVQRQSATATSQGGLAAAAGFFGGPARTIDASVERLNAEGGSALHAAAVHGIAGASEPLPHLDAIQRAFGRYDVTQVKAHTGGAATTAADAIGAEAFATGDHVAFGRAPSLHTAAHEAAHVVQQRGGVHLQGGIGEAGDAYERHADDVAARVVAGESAEPLLAQMAGGAAPVRVLQAKFIDEQRAEKTFGEDGWHASYPKLIERANALIAQLPPPYLRWMETLSHEAKMVLLHQMFEQRGVALIENICHAFGTSPELALPDPANTEQCLSLLRMLGSGELSLHAQRDPDHPDPAIGELKAIYQKAEGPMSLQKLGEQHDMVAKLKAIYTKADLEMTRHDVKEFAVSSAAGRLQLARIRDDVVQIQRDRAPEVRQILQHLTDQLSEWLKELYARSAQSLQVDTYSILAVGSMGRGEIFPHSDLDYTVLVDKVTSRVAQVEQHLNLKLKAMGEPVGDPIGQGRPEEVASSHLIDQRDVLMDARPLHSSGPGGQGLNDRYFQERKKITAHDDLREVTATTLVDTTTTKFSPDGQYLSGSEKDVKKGVLRLPVFLIRDLALYYLGEPDVLNVWDRIDDLVRKRHLDPELGEQMKFVVDFASRLRLKLHQFHGAEVDSFALASDLPKGYGGYVLTSQEEVEFRHAGVILHDLQDKAREFSTARAVTLAKLLEGAKEEKQDKNRDGDDVTVYRLASGEQAILEDAGFFRIVHYQSVKYFVEDQTGVLKDRNGHKLPLKTNANPFG